jgi:trigger factor
LDIVLDKISKTEALIKINLKENDYQPKVEEKIKEYCKKANIKGFRAGKVPAGVIKKMYGKSILVEEVNQMLSHSLMDYIKENDIQILGEPLPNMEKAEAIDWETENEFDFEYSIGMANEFDLAINKKIKVEKFKIKVDDKALAETIDNLKKQFGEMTNPDVCENGDTLYGEFITEVDGEPQTGTFDLNELEKKEAKNFVGKKKADTVHFNAEKAIKNEAYMQSIFGKLEGIDLKKVEFKVININRVIPTEINQELFDKTFGKDAVTTEEEFKIKIKESISENYDKESENHFVYNLRNKVVESTKMDLPNEFLKKFIAKTNKSDITPEQIESDYPMYSEDLKWTLIKNKVSKEQDIKAEHEDVLNATKAMIRMQFAGSGMGDQMEASIDTFADNYLKGGDGQSGENYMKMHESVFNDKVVAYIKENITIKEKEVTAEEFRKKA